jgi:hypothetical protein
MSASRPSSLIVDDDDDWGAISPLPSGVSHVVSSVTSGEFNAFAAVGSLAGGGSKRKLWAFLEGMSVPCLGKVGLNNNKFCVKECVEGKSHCGVNRHGTKFDVTPDTAYIRVLDNQVSSSPTLDLTLLTRGQRDKLLEASMSMAGWEVCLQDISLGNLPDWLNSEKEVKAEEDSVGPESIQLLSPIGAKEKAGVFQIVPTFSFDSEVSEDEETAALSGTMEGRVKNSRLNF